jgi:aspartyl-tRNA(Asn)/glutamyl-tRNA(Gln) amidotransferase subunit A
MAPTELHFITLAQAARMIAAKEISPVELTETYLTRIAKLDHLLDSFVTVTAERARQDASAAEAEIMSSGVRSKLHGIPYCLKDIYDTAGIRTTAHSKLLADNVPTRDSAAGEKLTAAGAVLLGKNATWEFAHGGPSWDILFPPARNPWNTNHTPAGSSSGSGAAVAAGFAPATMGSDTGGSIRGPAAANGIAGLKPTYGLVSRRGVIPNCFSHDHAGPLAWTCEDLALLMDVVAGHDPEDPASANVKKPNFATALTGEAKGLVIGVPWQWLEDELPLSAPTRANFDAALDVFKDMGAEIRDVSLPRIKAFEDSKKTIAMVELFSIHAQDLRTRPELFGASLRYRIIAGGLIRGEDYVLAMRARTDLARAMQIALADIDVLMLPTAEPAGKLEPTHPSSLFTKSSFTTPFNVGGNPALSVCSGFTEDGLPFSLQIVGKLFDDANVLRIGDAYEKATPWRERRPTLTDGLVA